MNYEQANRMIELMQERNEIEMAKREYLATIALWLERIYGGIP